jgi:hypothetical protein
MAMRLGHLFLGMAVFAIPCAIRPMPATAQTAATPGAVQPSEAAGYSPYQTPLYRPPTPSASDPVPTYGDNAFTPNLADTGQSATDPGAPKTVDPLANLGAPRQTMLQEYTDPATDPPARIRRGYSTPMFTTSDGAPSDAVGAESGLAGDSTTTTTDGSQTDTVTGSDTATGSKAAADDN